MHQAALPGTLALSLHGITKHFPGVTALDQVNLDLHHGEIHALLSENGGGKSTLIKILSGVHAANDGYFIVGGSRIAVTRADRGVASRHHGGATGYSDGAGILHRPEYSVGR